MRKHHIQLSFTAHSKYWQTAVCCLSVVILLIIMCLNVDELCTSVWRAVRTSLCWASKYWWLLVQSPNKTLLHLKGPNIHRHFFNSQHLGKNFFSLWLGNCPVYFCHFRNTSSILCRVQNEHFPSDKCLPIPLLLFYQTQVMWVTKMPF